MSGFRAFLGKELREIRRTWRIWVIPGMMLFFAVTAPIVALITPAILASIVRSQPGLTIKLPPATSADAYAQFLKNLNQIVVITLIIAGAGAISGERASGTAVLTLTKPISRPAFVLAKIVSQALSLVVFAALGTVVCAAVTAMIFGPTPVRPLAIAVLLWLVYALLLVIVTTLFSASFAARGAAAGAGLGFMFVCLLLSAWPLAATYSFAGLLPATWRVLAGQPVAAFWPVFTAVAAGALLTAVAIRVFERLEL